MTYCSNDNLTNIIVLSEVGYYYCFGKFTLLALQQSNIIIIIIIIREMCGEYNV